MDNSLNYLIAQGLGPKAQPFDYLDAQRKAQQVQLGEQQIQENQVKLPLLQQQAQHTRDQWLREKEFQPMRDELEAIKYLREVGPLISWEKYPESRQWLTTKNKIHPSWLPEPEHFQKISEQTGDPPAKLFEEWKHRSLTSLDQRVREEMAGAKLESAEKIAAAKIEGADRVAQSRLDAYGQRQDLFFKHQKDIEDLRAQHRKELEGEKATGREGKDLLSRQKEARLSVFKLYGMGEFSQYDEGLSDKAGKALEQANKMLAADPDLDPMTAAAQAKRRVDRQYKAIEGIQNPKKRKETTQAIRNSLDGGVDTADLLQALLSKGWSRQDAIQVIRDAAAIQ
jgi:hypothetical protein